MLIFHKEWWTAPYVSFLWVRAVDLAMQGKYPKAIKKLSRIESMAGIDAYPLGVISAEYYLLRARICNDLNNLDDAASNCQKMRRVLKHTTEYQVNEKRYFLAAGMQLDGVSDEWLDKNGIGKVALDDVRPGIKSIFPLTAHPEWPIREDRDERENDKENG